MVEELNLESPKIGIKINKTKTNILFNYYAKREEIQIDLCKIEETRYYFYYLFVCVQHKVWVPCAAESQPSAVQPSSLLLARTGIWNLFHGAGDSSHTLQQGHCGIYNVHQRMLADGTPV